MITDVRLHGITGNDIEYHAIAAGVDVSQLYLFATPGSGNREFRFFAGDNEFALTRTGITFQGNGGSFCEYMFGVEQPISDLVKGDILNRLAMYGTYETGEGIAFGDSSRGIHTFDRIFLEGHAVCNYFFFVNSAAVSGSVRNQQQEIVRLLGKAVKRAPAVGREEDYAIIAEFHALLGDPAAQIFLFKLVNRKHRQYRDTFQDLYFRTKTISDDEFARLNDLAAALGVDSYQQERIRIDVMYRHRDNRRVVDEYRSILVGCHTRGSINRLENARLTRLKTLSVRNRIPEPLFYTLDEMLKKDKKMVDVERDYISETRQVLEGLFLHEREIESALDAEDIARLLFAKKKAVENRDHAFEELLLDATKACDEKMRDGGDIALLENFSRIITFFDRYDTTSSIINQLAFMEGIRISADMLRSLLGNRHEFETLRPGLFEELFIAGLFENKYLGNYGRKKVRLLVAGLAAVEEGQLTTKGLLDELQVIDREERLYLLLLEHVRDRIRTLYSRYATREEQNALKREVTEELHHKGLLRGEMPDHVFQETILTIKKEAVYLHTLLPEIVSSRDVALREDFLENSGLDRFYVEELEREYFELNDLPIDDLYRIRKGLN